MPWSASSFSSIDSSSVVSAKVAQAQTDRLAAADEPALLQVVHNAHGQILSLQWPQACQPDYETAACVGQSIEVLLGPVSVIPYLRRVQRVLRTQQPEQFQCVIRCCVHPVGLDFTLSPVVSADTVQVLGIGRRLETSYPLNPPIPNNHGLATKSTEDVIRYHALLTHIAANIRKTLDLKTIWQQTVDGLGRLLSLHRCLVCDYSQAMQTLTVVTEYYQGNLHPCLGRTFELEKKPDFLKTIQTLKPVISDFVRDDVQAPYTVLTMATCYRDEPNSVLLLQLPPGRPWHPLEIELINELTDQVGTAIAHAKLFGESQTLAEELRHANE
ncbi:MAG: GAF domain-containing protein, partial [Leptolyngbya sp. SIO4C1]|nr:GAF domain-containing protein [Leptolyngbya sp. SIO4C1]